MLQRLRNLSSPDVDEHFELLDLPLDERRREMDRRIRTRTLEFLPQTDSSSSVHCTQPLAVGLQ